MKRSVAQLLKVLLTVCLGCWLGGCGMEKTGFVNTGSSPVATGTGAIALRLSWERAVVPVAVPAALPVNVMTIRISVSGPGITAAIRESFAATQGEGTIGGIPAGDERVVTAEALDGAGVVTHKGTSAKITVLAGKTSDAGIVAMNPVGVAMNMDQTLSDGAQRTTLAFSALAMVTGNLGAQSFFPPGKVADYTGFQYLRDNDPDNMGHNTSFLTRVANDVIYLLNDAQFEQLKSLAVAQQGQIDQYAYLRFPLMKAFRRLLEGDLPAGSAGLNLHAVKKASRALYRLDGEISYDRAVLYAAIINSLTPTQRTYLDAMKGKGWKSWPDIGGSQIDARMKTLPPGSAVAVMTYAGDLFSWYAGSVTADVYFCPERHGTYFGSFYIKDAPAIGHEGYSIDEQLTATAGRALSESAAGYVSQSQAEIVSGLVEQQRDNLYAGSSNIVDLRTRIATLLRSLLTVADSDGAIKSQVLGLSEAYGDLDGANNHAYAIAMADLYQTLTGEQKTRLMELRKSIMSGVYADGTPFDFSTNSDSYLYSRPVSDLGLLAPYLNDTDSLFFEPTVAISGTISMNGIGLGGVTVALAGLGVTISDAGGQYSFTSLQPGNVLILPTMSGYSFSPESLSVSVGDVDQFGLDFTATNNGAISVKW